MKQITYRTATIDDETNILTVLKEVAPEIPIVLDGTEQQEDGLQRTITECRKSGKSWVAIESTKVVGFALARMYFNSGPISLRYIGASFAVRERGISSALIEKLKAYGMQITASVLHANHSKMADRLVKKGFKKVDSDENETRFKWDPIPS